MSLDLCVTYRALNVTPPMLSRVNVGRHLKIVQSLLWPDMNLWCQRRLAFLPFLSKQGNYLQINPTTMMLSLFHPPPSSTRKHVTTLNRVVYNQSGCSLSLKRHLSARYPVVLHDRCGTSKTKHQSITACLTCTSLSPSFSTLFFPHPHHFTTPSLLSYTRPSISLSLSVFLFPVLGHRALVHG